RAGDGGRPGATGGGPARAAAGTWRLVSDVAPSWRALPSLADEAGGVPGLDFSCPAPDTCYAANFASDGPGSASQLMATHDGGATWAPSTLPVALTLSGALACTGADTCAVLGVDGSGGPTFMETTDGGATWSSHPGPAALTGTGGRIRLSCATATSCLAVARPGPAAVPATGAVTAGADAFATSDGGATWSTSALPVDVQPRALQCISATDCVTSGNTPGAGLDPATARGSVLVTTDGGSTWTASTVPAALGPFGPLDSLACTATGTCLADVSSPTAAPELIASTDGGATWVVRGASGVPDGAVMSISCADGADCFATGVTRSPGTFTTISLGAPGFAASTADGGATWQATALPAGVGAVVAVSCPAVSSCYALAVHQGGAGDGSQPFVLLADGTAPPAGT
ncbi:MAG TPA: hypothetical protein VMB72_07770, partial [Acidimicrobiales bacterium]|nr:hypothetical protein [Acidimicrobiales bacterium]